MSQLPQISEAEYEVMKIVWEYAPISTNEITEKLVSTTQWKAKTIQTLIKRLTEKRIITYEKKSRVFVYTPLVKQNEYIQQQSHSFVKRFYNGNFITMLTSYLDAEDLSENDINQLKEILDNHTQKEEK